MKKLVLAAILTVFCCSLVACGKSNPITGYKAGDVTLGQYKGIAYTAESTVVEDSEVDTYIENNFLAQHKVNVLVTDRDYVTDGDTVNIDYSGYHNGEQFEGGTAYGADLTIGSHMFIEGFEESLVGHNIGESLALDLTFPVPYDNDPDLAGEDVTFYVTINSISAPELPEFTDELVAENTEYETAAEYRQYVYDGLKSQKEASAESSMQYQVAKQVIANATFNKQLSKDILKAKNNMIAQYDSAYSAYGVDGATFFNYIYGMTAEQYDEYMEASAKMSIEYSYVISAIADQENITASDEEVEIKAEEMMESYGVETVEDLYVMLANNFGAAGVDVVRTQTILDKAADVIFSSAVAK